MKGDKNKNLGRRKFLLRSWLAVAAVPLLPISCQQGTLKSVDKLNENTFEFAFLTDIHIKPEMNAPKGFQMAIDKVNELNPDFVITGGDFVYHAMRGNYEKSESLFDLYKDMSKGFGMPVYNCI